MDEFPIYTLEEVDLSVPNEEQEQTPLHEQVARRVIFNNPEPVMEMEENGDEEERELRCMSRPVYGDDVDVAELFEAVVVDDEEEHEIEGNNYNNLIFGSKAIRNRITALEVQNERLTQLLYSSQKETAAVREQYQQKLEEMQTKLDAERIKMKAELTELNRKHIEELQAKQTLHGKVENMEKLRIENDALILDIRNLEIKHGKVVDEQSGVRSELSSTKLELTKTKAELGRMKNDYDACKADVAEKNGELSRLRKELEAGKGSQDQQVKTLTTDKLRLEEQINVLKREVADRTQQNNRLSADITALERNTALLNTDIASLQQQAARADVLDRELHQTKWRVTCLEKEVQDAGANFKFQLAQAQQASAMNAAMSSMYSAPPPPQRPVSAALPTYQPAYHPPYVPPPAPAPQPQLQSRAQAQPSYNPYNHTDNSSSSGGYGSSNYNTGSGKNGPGNYPGAVPSLAALAAGTGFGASHNNDVGAYANGVHSSAAASSSARPRATSAPRNGLGGAHAAPLQHQQAQQVVDSTASAPFGTASKSPFANEVTSAQINHVFDELDRRLTSLMTEKSSLQDESERLHARGLKTLKDRTRLQNVEFRLGELSRDITYVRKELAFKPG